MAETQTEKKSLDPTEIVKRPATYAALVILGGVFLWLIFLLNGQVVKTVDDIKVEVRAVNVSADKTREEFVIFREQTNANFKEVNGRLEAMDKRLSGIEDQLKKLVELAEKKK